MDDVNLITISLIAFTAVLVLLGMMAGMINLITYFFADKRNPVDSTLIAAIGANVASVLPGAKVVKIEELKATDG